MALKFTVHGVQSFIKGHRKSGVISIKHSRDITHRISPLRFLPVSVITATLLQINFVPSYPYIFVPLLVAITTTGGQDPLIMNVKT